MKVFLERVDDNFHFEIKNQNGHVVHVDNKNNPSGVVHGASPMELLLMGVAGCSGIDLIAILKKQKQQISSYKAEVVGDRTKIGDATPFTAIDVTIYLEGDIKKEKALRAARLSFDKYCSVSKTIEPTASITYSVVLNNEKIEA